jgi:hypothetical protein
MTEWFKRVVGYGGVLVAPWIAQKTGNAELGQWVATGVSLVGAIVLNKALPFVFPTAAKIARATGASDALRK